MIKKDILFEMKCKSCKKYFLYCMRNGNDYRCYDCRKGITVEAVQKELEEMPKEEYDSFLEEIKEYEQKNRKKT